MADTNYTYKIKKAQGITPVFVATAVVDNLAQVEFFCPYCAKYHRHGAGDGGFEGHRSAHCTPETPLSMSSYYLITEKRSRSRILGF